MLMHVILAFVSVHVVYTHKHVIRLTQNVARKGFEEDLDLGEVISEKMVDSPVACGQLCHANPACRSVMLMGQLCRMFGQLMLPVSTLI